MCCFKKKSIERKHKIKQEGKFILLCRKAGKTGFPSQAVGVVGEAIILSGVQDATFPPLEEWRASPRSSDAPGSDQGRC